MTSASSGQHLYGFDPHFKIFHELMAYRIREILLVSSPYDAYIMEEDVSLTSRIINEYQGLNLSHPPRITRVSGGEQALDLLEQRSFDLIVAMPRLGGMDSFTFSRKVRQTQKAIPLVLLSHSPQETASLPDLNSCIDNAYVWCCDSDLLLAIVKSVEDQRNVANDTARAMVRVILLVEDSAEYRSRLLPMLYGELVKQTHAVLGEGLNEQHRLLKMRARPKILTASSYEEAWALFTRYEPFVFCVMSDARFPMNGRLDDRAGQRLLMTIRSKFSDLPLLMLSSDSVNRESALQIPAVFVDKNASNIPEQVHEFFLQYLGFGDFVFRLPDGTHVAQVSSLQEFESALHAMPEESIRYHASHNHFSNWVMARAEVALAARLHRDHFVEITDGRQLRQDVLARVHALRKLRQKGVVAQFHRDRYDPEVAEFVRIGTGSMGGKARGIAFIASELRHAAHQKTFSQRHAIHIPQTCVITTTGFEAFVECNGLQHIEDETDGRIAKRFIAGRLPDWLEADLRAYLAGTTFPLSVRSSSMLEDAQFRPYAGLYSTTMLANCAKDFEERLAQLFTAVKLVYASTWFEGPRAFSRSVGHNRDDHMAVIIQQLVGRRSGSMFYPAISGVVQSFNYYPIGRMAAEDGIAHIALGFGKTVVEGERSLRFSPALPQNLPQFSTVEEILANGQQTFYALDCSDPSRFSTENNNLVRREVNRARDEYPVRLLSSTYSHEDDRIRDADLPGHKIVTFAPVLKHGFFPLPSILRNLVELGREGMGCEVEIEFAVNLDQRVERSEFHFLQIRPMVTGGEHFRPTITDEDRSSAIIHSVQSLGHGRNETISDVVYVLPETFAARKTREIAQVIAKVNKLLHRQQRPYLLIGPGRWGSADPWLGIPVQWNNISGVGAIVELQSDQIAAEPSQGSHFFQNITSLGIPYLMVESCGPDEATSGGFIDWSRIRNQEVLWESSLVAQVRFREPLRIKVNGRTSEAVVLGEARRLAES